MENNAYYYTLIPIVVFLYFKIHKYRQKKYFRYEFVEGHDDALIAVMEVSKNTQRDFCEAASKNKKINHNILFGQYPSILTGDDYTLGYISGLIDKNIKHYCEKNNLEFGFQKENYIAGKTKLNILSAAPKAYDLDVKCMGTSNYIDGQCDAYGTNENSRRLMKIIGDENYVDN